MATNPEERLASAIDRLFNREDIDIAVHEPIGGANVTPYEYLVLTDKGRDRLERGLVER